MIQKLLFTKQDEYQNAKETDVIGKLKDLVVISTIEIKNPNPSELIMLIEKKDANGARIRRINLADYRTKFIFQNDVYIIDTKQIIDFNDPNSWAQVKIAFRTIDKDDPIKVEVFYALSETSSLNI